MNTTALRRTGTESLDYRGTYDAFQILLALRDDLRNLRGLPQTQQLESISQRIEELDRVRAGVLQSVGEQSATLQNLDGLETHILDVQLTTRKLISALEDADLSQIVIHLQAQENLLRLTLASTARLFDQSLLDFLR